MIFVTLALVGGCAEYGGNGGPECYTLAECNPGKECGEMIKCVDGKCDPGQTENLPCQQVCASDQDCPAGMHCRTDVCVADGTCAEVSECLGLPHDACVGSFACKSGLCQWECSDITSCSQHADCVLADKGCCCGFDVEDYISIREDKVSEWRQREECQDVDCPAVACSIPESIEAVCQQGHCSVGTKNSDWYACDTDSDCVKVAADCCGCQNGGGEKAVNKNSEEAYLKELNDFCAVVDVKCDSYDTCTTWNAVCHQGLCTTLDVKCGCEDDWDPVCGGTGGLMYTFGSECEADCVEMPWHYHGNCNCAMDCDGGLGSQVCANNGQSYWCGEWEAQCNGQTVHYPGECSADCDMCDMLGRPSIPVCGEDFRYYPDMCYAECHGLGWWHQGECLTGEGAWCGGIMGQPCESSELFCLLPAGCMDCTGSCIALGSCMQAEDCIGQPLVGDDCEGSWACPNHVCNWVCN
ncbi:hypothetical protein ACFL2F_04470 [Myxococcota bacterium]